MTVLVSSGITLFSQNIPLAIFIVVCSSFLFAGGATLQHFAIGGIIDKDSANRSMGMKQLLQMVTTPKWALGLALIGIGASAHIVGLMMAPVTVVQPVGILAVPWSVLLAAKIHGHKPSKEIWAAVAMTIIGIIVFTYFSASNAAKTTDLSNPLFIVIGCLFVLICGIAFGVFGWFGPAKYRCLAWATGGSFCYGLSSAIIKTISEKAKLAGFHGDPLFWFLVVALLCCYLIGGWMIQQGYANGPAEIVVGSMTTTDPIIGVAFGLIILGEGALIGPFSALFMAAAGAFAIYGVVVLSKHHPDSQR